MSSPALNERPGADQVLVDIANYVAGEDRGSNAAYEMARYCLMDALGCAMQAFEAPECVKLLGPTEPGTIVPYGARVPGTQFELSPIKAAFDIGCLIRWSDFNDTGPSGGHPSDNLGGILATADYLSRTRRAKGGAALGMREVMAAMIKAYEIQGVLWEGNSFDRPEIGLDPCALLGKIASTAVVTRMWGGGIDDIIAALSNAIVDGHSLFMYRKVPYAGSRKSWAAADATSRAVRLAQMTMRGEMGYPQALSAKAWGFCDVLYGGKPLAVPRPFGCQEMENVLFKIAYPAQRNTQSAAECAVRLHAQVKGRIDDIEKIVLGTHEVALRGVTATGPLANFAARDHNLQYVVAVALLDGNITPASYEDEHAADPRIDRLRSKMEVVEDGRYTRGYRDPKTRSNANSVQIFFRDGSSTEKVEVEYPIGDPSRRREGAPLLEKKFRGNLARRLAARQQTGVAQLLSDQSRLEATTIDELMDMLVV